MTPAGRAGVADQRRQRRADAHAAILTATRDLLERHVWHELPVEEITHAAGLSRTVFYRHFADRRALLLALLDEVGEKLTATGQLWIGTGSADPVADVEVAARALTDFYREHGRMLQAFADAAAEDVEVRAAYEQLGESLAVAVSQRFADDAARGIGQVEHTSEVARALIWMNERYLLSVFGRPENSPADAGAVAAAITEIWTAVGYGRPAR